MTKAIILLSGGIDSTVALALAINEKKQCLALSFDYGQRHRVELEAAQEIAAHYQVAHRIIKIEASSFGQSSLVDNSVMPEARTATEMSKSGIPNTYVPARNTLFLAYALGQCELHQAHEIHFGPNLTDHSCYPDCRPAYMEAFQTLMNVATKQAVEGKAPKLVTPFLYLKKADIIKMGMQLKAPLHLTMSCYQPKGLRQPCGVCDPCVLRKEGGYC